MTERSFANQDDISSLSALEQNQTLSDWHTQIELLKNLETVTHTRDKVSLGTNSVNAALNQHLESQDVPTPSKYTTIAETFSESDNTNSSKKPMVGAPRLTNSQNELPTCRPCKYLRCQPFSSDSSTMNEVDVYGHERDNVETPNDS
ncbi:hypothetical protein GEMRC1_002511 [Eukaryota sp. GEM-RC1]